MSGITVTPVSTAANRPMADKSAPVGTAGELDSSKYIDDSFITPEKMNVGLHMKSRQRRIRETVFNPSPSDVEEEAIHGKRVYKEAVVPDSPKQMREKQTEQTAQIDKLTALVDVLIKDRGKAQAPAEPTEPVEESVSWKDLRTMAKAQGINTKGMSRKQIEESLAA